MYRGLERRKFEKNEANVRRSLDIRLNDGRWVRVSVAPEAKPPVLPVNLIVMLTVALSIIIFFVMLAVRQATHPLEQLSQAADNFGHDLDASPLPETGPSETLRAARAFNRMQDRIKHLVSERSRALAAVSHDLRTPLTRMRLRAELVEDESLRDQMVADLDSMAAMIDTTLNYLRGLQESELSCPIDINALVHSLMEDEALLGRTISLDGLALSPYVGRPSALRRALQNLADNALKYGCNVHLIIHDSESILRITVNDDGKGVPEAEILRLAEPYYRPGAARCQEAGGSGLGLSIVKDVALMHGGELNLANHPEGGFSASLILPRQAK